MPDGRPPYRQYAGLAFVILTYVGGIIGWSCAAQQVESASPPNSSAQTVSVDAAPPAASVPTAVDAWSSRARPAPDGRAQDRLRLLSPLVPSHQTLTPPYGWSDVDARIASVRR